MLKYFLNFSLLRILTTFSAPFIQIFYFVHSSVDGGVKFGLWGWCLDVDGSCPVKQYFVSIMNIYFLC